MRQEDSGISLQDDQVPAKTPAKQAHQIFPTDEARRGTPLCGVSHSQTGVPTSKLRPEPDMKAFLA